MTSPFGQPYTVPPTLPELERFWPGAVKIFRSLDSPIALAFLEKYPSPIEATALGEQRLAAFLRHRHYSGGKTPRELLAKLRSAPQGRAGEVEVNTRRQLVLALVALLKPLVVQIKQLERQIAQALAEHPDGELFRPLFRDRKSVITATELVSEIGDCRGRYPTGDALAGDAGQAAVAIESGKRKVACYRWSCNKRLRNAFCTLADSTRHWHPWAADHYARAIAPRPRPPPRDPRPRPRLVPHPLALLARPTPYDPARHRRLQRHALVTIPTSSGPRPDLAATLADARRSRNPQGGPQGRARSA